MRFTSRRSTQVARNGMVATSHPLATSSALRVLMEGGNAVDAAVTAAAVLNVTEPAATGMGGDLFAMVWMAREKRVRALNSSGRAPAAASLDEMRAQGLRTIPDRAPCAVTVPGAVRGWEALLRECGTISVADAVAPAARYASEGHVVPEVESGLWAGAAPRLHPEGRNELLRDGRAPRAGEVIQLPELASSLRAVAEGGAGAFYAGPLGDKIAAHVQRLGGWLSTDDLATHTAEWVEPIYTDYRGVRCWQCPPNSQGVNVLMALNLAEGFDIAAMGFQSPDTYHHLIECMRLAFADGLQHVTDPDEMRVSVQEMYSKPYADSRRGLIQRDRAMPEAPVGPLPIHSDTVYLSVVDGEGNACSLINSVFMGFGSGIVVPGTGIALHNRGASFSLDPDHANALAPRKRPYHTLIPGMATRGGELWLTYGVMGAMQQAQGHLQVLSNMIDFGLSPQAALDAPRFSVRLGEGVAIEDIAPAKVVSDLASRGHRVIPGQPHGVMFGSGQAIERDAETGVLKGGSEPRKDGAALGW